MTTHAFQPAMDDQEVDRVWHRGGRPRTLWSQEPTPAPARPPAEDRGTAGGAYGAVVVPFAWRLTGPLEECFELSAGRRRLARLTISGLYSSAVVETDERSLLLTPDGVGDRRVAIADGRTRSLVADFEWRRRRQRGTLKLIEGGRFEWRRTGWWQPTFAFTDRFGNRPLRLHPNGHALGYGLGPEPALRTGRDLVLMLALGWYLLVVSGTATPPKPLALV
jgi:hypothetical protein